MNKEIKYYYDINNPAIIKTICPYGKSSYLGKTRVGSFDCLKNFCGNFVDKDEDRQTVICKGE